MGCEKNLTFFDTKISKILKKKKKIIRKIQVGTL